MSFDQVLRGDKFDSASMAYLASHDDGLRRKEQVFRTVIIPTMQSNYYVIMFFIFKHHLFTRNAIHLFYFIICHLFIYLIGCSIILTLNIDYKFYISYSFNDLVSCLLIFVKRCELYGFSAIYII